MNKVKMLVLAGLAAATVGVGALAAAPSASASTPQKPKKAAPTYLRFQFQTVFTTGIA